MKIDKLIIAPRDALNYMERYINDGSPSGFTWEYSTSKSTSPMSANKRYKLLWCHTQNRFIKTYGSYPHFLNCGSGTILIHPDMAKDKRLSSLDIGESNINVMPTSSARTVQLCDFPGYLKLNYWGTIGRVNRALTTKHIASSMEITQLLKETFTKQQDSFHYLSLLPECSAQAFVSDNLDFGNVYREEKPTGGGAEKVKYLVPFFSLFSNDKNNPNDKAIVLQLADVLGIDLHELVVQQIIYPIIKYYFLLITQLGLQPEWHSQNILLGLDEDLKIASFVMRDIESIDVDSTIRKQLGLKHILSCYPYKHIYFEQYNYQIKHSFMFDFKLGEYLIEPLVDLVSSVCSIDKSNLYFEIKDYSQKYIKLLPDDFFPQDNCWYAVKPILIDRTKAERPYTNMGMPKFR